MRGLTFTNCQAYVAAAIKKIFTKLLDEEQEVLNTVVFGFSSAGGAIYSTATNLRVFGNQGSESNMISCIAQPIPNVDLYDGATDKLYDPPQYELIEGYGGGAILNPASNVDNSAYKIWNTEITGNTANNGDGGGVWANNTGLEILNSKLSANVALLGGGLFVSGDNSNNRGMAINRSTFSENVAGVRYASPTAGPTIIGGAGGGIYLLDTNPGSGMNTRPFRTARLREHGSRPGRRHQI